LDASFHWANLLLPSVCRADFLAGQYFDLRVEVHAPLNGSEAVKREPDEKFTVHIQRAGSSSRDISRYFRTKEPVLEKWTFNWFEGKSRQLSQHSNVLILTCDRADLFARAAGKPSVVRVTSKVWRRVTLQDPGQYTVTLRYNDGQETKAKWLVRDLETERKAKNVILFIGDGMSTSMITAARLIAHKSVNGKYQSKMVSAFYGKRTGAKLILLAYIGNG
jgi:hypothetical protein